MNPILEDIKKECGEKNWDSYGAYPVTQASLEKADLMLEWVKVIGAKEPRPVPTGEGGIQLEWHTGGLLVELEIAPDGQACDFLVFSKESKLILNSRGVE